MTDLEKISEFVRKVHADNQDGHGFDHIERVVALAERILATEPRADRELVLTACYLHDTYDEKICEDAAAQKAADDDFLCRLGFDEARRDEIFEIIDHMSYSSNLTARYRLDINGQIVQDADRLEAMGAAMIVRALEYGWAHHRVLYDPNIPPVKFDEKETYHSSTQSTTLNHFYEKAFKLYDLLNTDEARRLGAPRDQLMRDFVAAFEREWAESH